uniref:Uncharacterized protein n=1 Tax=Meloidogyne javanica TaxID=6303 RepID=A0A915MIM2_MELJA
MSDLLDVNSFVKVMGNIRRDPNATSASKDSALELAERFGNSMLDKKQNVFVWDLDSLVYFLIEDQKATLKNLLDSCLNELVTNGNGFIYGNLNLPNIDIQTEGELPGSSSTIFFGDDLKKKAFYVRNVYENNKDGDNRKEFLTQCNVYKQPSALEELFFLSETNKLFLDCLESINNSTDCINIILSFNKGVVEAMGVLMLCQFSCFVEARNIYYISGDVSKMLLDRFNKENIKFIVTDGVMEKFAKDNKFVQCSVKSREDVQTLRDLLHADPQISISTIDSLPGNIFRIKDF